MQQESETKLYLSIINLPQENTVVLDQLLQQQNVRVSNGSPSKRHSQKITRKDSNIAINAYQIIYAKLHSVFTDETVGLQQLEDFGKFMVNHSEEIISLYSSQTGFMEAISIIIMKNYKKYIKQTDKQKQLQITTRSLINGLIKVEQTLQGQYSYQLFLGLVQLQFVSSLKKSSQQMVEYFKQFVNVFTLIQKYVKNKQQFKCIRKILNILAFILAINSQNKIPQNYYDYISGKNQNLQIKQKQIFFNKDSEQKFYQTLYKYGLVDPQYRSCVLLTIKFLFDKGLQSETIVNLFKVVLQLMKRKVFPDYQQNIVNQLNNIKVKPSQASKQIFTKIIDMLADQLDADSLIACRVKLSKLIFDDQLIKKRVFLRYYKILKQFETENFNSQTMNIIMKQIIKYHSMHEQQQFSTQITKLLSSRVQYIREQLQAQICISQSSVWGTLSNKIMEHKCKQFLNNSILNYDHFGASSQVYRLYTRMFIQIILNTSFDKLKSKQTFPSSFIIINNIQLLKRIKQHAQVIFQHANRNMITNMQFLWSFSFLNSLLQIIKPVQMQKSEMINFYITVIRKFSKQQILEFLQSINNVFHYCKNAFSLFLILGCGLQIHNNFKLDQQMKNKYTGILQKLMKCITVEGYCKIMSYHNYNIKLLIMLSYISKSDYFSRLCQQFIASWAALFSQADLQLILYQFDINFYSYLMKAFQIRLDPQQQIQRYVFFTLSQINDILKQPSCINSAYLNGFNNAINFIPIRHANHRNSLTLSFKALINPKLCCNSFLQIYGTPRNQLSTTIQKQRIIFKNKKIIFYNRITKEIQGSLQDISEEIYHKPFSVLLKFQNSRVVVIVNKTQLINKQYDILVDNIKLELLGDIIIKDFRWQRFQQQQNTLKFNQGFQIFPSEAEVKILSTYNYSIINFQQKINLFYLCAYLLQLIKITRAHVNLNRYFSFCCDIITKKQGSSKDELTTQQFSCVRHLFKIILKYSGEKDIKIELPQKSFANLSTTAKKLYYLITSSVVNERFLGQANRENRLRVIKYLSQLLFAKHSEFRTQIQNRKMRIIMGLANSVNKNSDADIRKQYFKIIQKIVCTHEANQILLKKISFLFYLAYGTKSEHFKQFYDQLVLKIFSVINHSDNAQNHHLKKIGKFILLSHSNLQLIFLMANTQIKTKILDSMIDDEQLSIKCHRLFEQLPSSQILELSSWLIVYCKRTIFYFFDDKKRNQLNLLNLLFFIKQAIKIYPIQHDKDHKQEILSMLLTFMKKSINMLSQKPKQEIVQQIYIFFSYPHLIKLIGQKIAQNSLEQVKSPQDQMLINNYFVNLFKFMPKVVILSALQEFRKISQSHAQCCMFMLHQQFVLLLPERAMSAFLQYLIQILFILKYEDQQQKLKQLASIINEWMQKIIKNYQKISHIPQPILYSYPKMQKRSNITQKSNVQKIIDKIQNLEKYELKGGILFKMMCITFHLIQALPETDLSVILMYFLQKIAEKNKNKNQANFRAVADFIQVSKQTKTRSSLDVANQAINQKHLKYYEQEDQQIIMSANFPLRKSSSKPDVDVDLTPFFIDYFLMKICLYLQNKCEITQNSQVLQVCQKYSNQILKILNQQKHIWDQMNQKNSQSKIYFQNIQDLVKMTKQDQNLTVSDMMFSPNFTSKRFTNQQGTKNYGFIQIDKQQTDSAFYGTPVKQTKLTKRRSTINFDLNSGKKKKKQLISLIQGSIYTWSDEAKKKKFHQFFRQQSKQILLNELFHELFVIKSNSKCFKKVEISKGKRLINFLTKEGDQFVQKDNNSQTRQINKNRLRKIYKFTCQIPPCLKLKRRHFPNQTFPLTTHMKQRIQIVSHSQQNLTINPDFIFTILHKQLDSPAFNVNTVVCLNQEEQDIKQPSNLCQISNPKGVYFCEWELQQKSIVFTTKPQKSATKKAIQRILKYGSPLCNILAQGSKKITLQISSIHEIFFRKYNQVRNNSIQLFLKNGASIYVIFYTQHRTKAFLQQCKKKFPPFKFIKIVQNFTKVFQNQGYTQKWVAGQISNFDYLMVINKYAGRTYCDLNQYYVFPWILQDYTSQYLDISSSKTFRDLKKPIGALRSDKFDKYKQKLSNTHSEICDQYLYGSHYSTSLFIYYYFVRLQPFTTLHKDMQGGDYDAPDRLFSSMEQMWQCLTSQSSTSDIKQSIPQFYYFPTFLKNTNNLNLGEKQSGQVVSDVKLPPWADNPTDFILKMRSCLQSDYVSSNLNFWIDLIFGKDQKSMQKSNVFHPLSYVENVNPQKIEFENLDAIMSQISFFGQNPYTLFTRQHPRRKTKLNSINANNLSLYASSDLSSFRESTTSSMTNNSNKIFQQQNLDIIYYVSSMFFKNKNVIVMKISGISKNVAVRTIDLDMQNTIHSLVRALQKVQKGQGQNMKRMLSQTNIQIPLQKLTTQVNIKNNGQFSLRIGVKDKAEIAKTIKINYKFKDIKYNQIIFVAYGMTGLRIYNWNQQIIWQCSDQVVQICECYLQPELLFFVTSTGKLYVYDFFRSSKQLIFEYPKHTHHVRMLVYSEKRYITKRNQLFYKFLLVGDGRKIIFLHYTHKKNKFQLKFT